MFAVARRAAARRWTSTAAKSSGAAKRAAPAATGPGGLKGNNVLAIRREDKNRWERRSPLGPSHVAALVRRGVKVLVQPSSLRVFSDAEYERSGAVVQEDISDASTIVGVKEVPIHRLVPDRTFLFFSHTIKAQEYNMPLLDAILANNIRLIDYERITDGDSGNRLVKFGRYAGYAGFIDFLHGLGNRLLAMGFSTPLLHVGYTHMYSELDSARHAVTKMGEAIKQRGLPLTLGPLIFVFTGSGGVSSGAQAIFELLPHRWITPQQAKELVEAAAHGERWDNNVVYGVLASSEVLYRRVRGDGGKGDFNPNAPFDRAHYFAHPEQYESVFAEKLAPYASVIINSVYWDQRCPRLLTYEQTEHLVRQRRSRLIGLADLSADVGGSIEWMKRLTSIDRPFYVYDVEKREEHDELDYSRGVLVMSVDNLPSEIPVEASTYFGDSLLPFVENLVRSDASVPVAEQAKTLNTSLYNAIITSGGELAPNYKYIAEYRARNEAAAAAADGRRRGGDSVSGRSRNVLVLGAGMVSAPCVNYLLENSTSTSLMLVDSNKKAAEAIVRDRRNTRCEQLDINDTPALTKLIEASDVVVSLLPAPLHPRVARMCIDKKRHLITTSYVSDEMRALHDDASAAGVTVLNEVGLDPGIDHLLAMRVIDETRAAGHRVRSFVSYCGGLPAPEYSDNPLGYKFSWSPRGVLNASAATAKWLSNGDIREAAAGTLFDQHTKPVRIFPGFALEAYPNRDSTTFQSLYGLDSPDTHTFVRATLRYRGFGVVLDALSKLGYCSPQPSALFAAGAPQMTWRAATQAMLTNAQGVDIESSVLTALDLNMPTSREESEHAAAVIDAFRWLGLFDETAMVPQLGSPLEALCALMQQRMALGTHERDMVLMHHEFRIDVGESNERLHTSTLVMYGDDTASAMARTVGTTAAISARLVLDGHIVRRGVVIPTTPDIYIPLLNHLEAAGITSNERSFDALRDKWRISTDV
mmetsp:Transcript_36889/g.90311  ORF Transcript_36889/g.90311 Transcript_36889/m.90311 type:complete len:982 (-) Transcript_36889:89-3034(-)